MSMCRCCVVFAVPLASLLSCGAAADSANKDIQEVRADSDAESDTSDDEMIVMIPPAAPSSDAGNPENPALPPEDGGPGAASEVIPDECEGVEKELAIELENIQACVADSDCGASEPFDTCGCTRALPVRVGAVTKRYIELKKASNVCTQSGGGVCDCPPANGFLCTESRCAWNYVTDR
jgi:hypothetical protein